MLEIEYRDIIPQAQYEGVVEKTMEECYKEEKLPIKTLYVCVILTDECNIRKMNKEYRNIDKTTDVLSFPIFEKEELQELIKKKPTKEEIIGDIVISMPTIKEQAAEYGHSVERELAYMIVHGFFHLMGYDHMEEVEKKAMREKEEKVLQKLNLIREKVEN